MARIALIFLIVDNKILMCKREKKDNDKYSDMYGLPGGHVREHESYKEGAVRETKEETNLKIENPQYVKTYKVDDNEIHLFAKKIPNIDGIKLNHEHTDYKLFSLKELDADNVIPTTKEWYKDYKKHPITEEVERIKSLMIF